MKSWTGVIIIIVGSLIGGGIGLLQKTNYLPHRQSGIDIQGHQTTTPTNPCGDGRVSIPNEQGQNGHECVQMNVVNPSTTEAPISAVIIRWGDGPHDSQGKVTVQGQKGTTVYDDGRDVH